MSHKLQLFAVIILLFAIFSTHTTVSASSDDMIYTYYSDNMDIVIDLTNINETHAERIVGYFTNDLSYDVEPMNLLCTLFGHNEEKTISRITTHNYYSTEPHCKKDTYEVSICSRCDYTSSELINTTRVSCH